MGSLSQLVFKAPGLRSYGYSIMSQWALFARTLEGCKAAFVFTKVQIQILNGDDESYKRCYKIC